MNAKLKIFLPEYATSTKVFHVMSKFIGTPFYKSRSMKKYVDPALPCSIGNVWEIKFHHPYNSSVTRVDHQNEHHERIKLCDTINVVHIFDYYSGGQVDGQNIKNKVLLVVENNAVNGAIGKQLVDFFSGEMIAYDYEDPASTSKGVSYTYKSYIAIHPPFKKGKSIKKYTYQFENDLNEVQTINVNDLAYMRDRTRWTDSDDLLFHDLDSKFAKSYLAMDDLKKNLSEPNDEKVVKRIKI
jgi:uncharacterized protein YlbG (UPF0298 family)